MKFESKYLKEEVSFVLNCMGFESLDEFFEFVRFFVKDFILNLISDKIEYYVKRVFEFKNVLNLKYVILFEEMIDVLKGLVELFD